MESYKLKFENGRSCTIECDNKKSFQDLINEHELRFDSECVAINGKPIKKHSLGGFLVGATIGAILGNSVPAHSVSKTTRGVKRTAKTVKRTIKKQVKKFDEGGLITFDDGYQFTEVSEQYARENWQNEEIFAINLDDQTERVIEDESDIDAFELFGTEIGFKDTFKTGGRTPMRKYAISGGGLAKEYIVEATNKDEAIDKARRSLKTVFGNVPKNRFSYRIVSSFADGGSTEYNRSWHQDHNRHNKSESYEVPISDRKKFSGGGTTDDTRYCRLADDTGKGINDGYVVGDGEMYFETEKALIKYLRDSEEDGSTLSDDFLLKDGYDNEMYYYTEWDCEYEIEEQGYYYTRDGKEIEIASKGKKLAEGKVPRWWNKQVREYEFFVFNTETNKVWAGNEYLNDAKDELKEFKLDNPVLPLKVLSKRAITNKKINPLAYENWARSSEQFAEIRGEVAFNSDEIADRMETVSILKPFAKKVRGSQKVITRSDLEEMLPDYVSGSDLEFALSGKKFADGGMSSMAMAGAMPPQVAIANELSNKLPATTSAIDKRMAERIYSEKPSAWEDRGLQRMATGGMIGGDITFDRYGEQRSGTITEVFNDGKFAVSSGMGSYLVDPENVISFSAPKTEKKGWFFADGGSTEYNRSWHQDHNRHNKSESYEVPMSDRKKFAGGGKTEQRFQILSPDGFPLYRDRTFTEAEILPAFEEWKKRYEKQGYYSTSNRERIDLRDLADMVSVIKVSDEDYED